MDVEEGHDVAVVGFVGVDLELLKTPHVQFVADEIVVVVVAVQTTLNAIADVVAVAVLMLTELLVLLQRPVVFWANERRCVESELVEC